MSINEIEAKCREIRQLQNLIQEAEDEMEALKDQLKAHMGDQETFLAGEYSIRWKTVRSSRLDTAALRKALPEVAKRFH